LPFPGGVAGAGAGAGDGSPGFSDFDFFDLLMGQILYCCATRTAWRPAAPTKRNST